MAGLYAQLDIKGGHVVGRRALREPAPPDMDDLALFMWHWERGYRREWAARLERMDEQYNGCSVRAKNWRRLP